jgi:hypothetical protein
MAARAEHDLLNDRLSRVEDVQDLHTGRVVLRELDLEIDGAGEGRLANIWLLITFAPGVARATPANVATMPAVANPTRLFVMWHPRVHAVRFGSNLTWGNESAP